MYAQSARRSDERSLGARALVGCDVRVAAACAVHVRHMSLCTALRVRRLLCALLVCSWPQVTFYEFKQLRVLNLDGFGGITTLPTTIGLLVELHTLHLRECEALERLPASIGKLRKLAVRDHRSNSRPAEHALQLALLTSHARTSAVCRRST
jgi:hypothetical protein